ncbi:tail fiber domain-containing protein [Citrobacter braakii]|uniref:tail fiber domain-containing protein n=1 Tax=Citrobacter braakii TaxID=57706 RepID=UPI001907D58A|nr:tail fiber domain-containing protein [Citrobacter braakii]MBJ9240880.1 tail fiber domain-containing protein [Citrobacter braakii]
MADIFNGGTVKLFYNLDTANQNVISSGNIEIENVATFPTFSISDSANKIETYDSEYTRTVVGDKAIGDLEIVVNYRPDSVTHQFLDTAYDNKTEFQLILNYIQDENEGKVEAVIVSGNINSRMISGDKDDVVRMTYTYSPRTILSMGTRVISPVLRRGDYGIGSDGTPDYPQYSPREADGNAFVMIPAADTDNPAGVDLYGIELVSQPEGQTNSNLMMTNSGDLRIYARNNSTGWSRVYTSGESDTLYLEKADNLSDLGSTIIARTNLDVYSKSEGDARYMMGNRNLSEITDKNAALSNLGIIPLSEMDTRYLKTASNLSDLTDKDAALSNLGIISLSAMDSRYLKVASNLSDLTDISTARLNLGLKGFVTSATSSTMRSANGTIIFSVNDSGEWGTTQTGVSGWKALGIPQGGTGANDVPTAKTNLQVDRLQQITNSTLLTSQNSNQRLILRDDTVWGYFDATGNKWNALGVTQGGTGANNVTDAKVNLQIDRISQGTGYTSIFSSDKKSQLTVRDDGGWGMFISGTEPGAGWKALGIPQGGTGANNASDARTNLGLKGFVTGPTSSTVRSANGTIIFSVNDSGEWGTTQTGVSGWKALGIAQGGTGATNINLARTNLGIGTGDVVWFGGVVTTSSVTGSGGAWSPVIRKLKDQQSTDGYKNNQLSYVENSDIAVTNYVVTDPSDNSMQNVWQLTTNTSGTRWFSMRADNGLYTPEGRVAIQGSDVRIKENFEPVQDGAWDRISKIGICEYTYKSNPSPQRGYLAQQMGEIDPIYVFEGGQSVDDDGVEFKILNVNDKAVNADLITVVQELQIKLEDQQDQINQLMAMVHAQSITINELRNK